MPDNLNKGLLLFTLLFVDYQNWLEILLDCKYVAIKIVYKESSMFNVLIFHFSGTIAKNFLINLNEKSLPHIDGNDYQQWLSIIYNSHYQQWWSGE